MIKKAIQEESATTLVDPALVSVIGMVKDNPQTSSSPDIKAKKRQSFEESDRSSKDKDRRADSSVKD